MHIVEIPLKLVAIFFTKRFCCEHWQISLYVHLHVRQGDTATSDNIKVSSQLETIIFRVQEFLNIQTHTTRIF